MRTTQRQQSYTKLRLFCEKLQWKDKDGNTRRGPDYPEGATDRERVPFFVKYITEKGEVVQGMVTCIKVNTRRNMRLLKFTDSEQIRWAHDILIMEVDGIRIITH